ncbi:branched-chain amino acid ABC transporter permease [Pseudonocardia sp. RS11V-5]|uniref:branched-chain amino acid ABC transporter permease n=1 Tax=Pseudonocardia terrae TaxID=2905831 RepID=UPI001E3A0EF5|nr:branched-chain amino acid ABC transporter permease [Pseudonocardia terrae]MCE3550881.1 branched-chain amino acid ABC transporter permease [Pseudonocardia terrae]
MLPRLRSALPWVLFAAVIVLVGATGGPFLMTVGMVTALSIILSSGMNVAMGYGGLLNLGIGAFYGLGAYGTAILSLHFQASFWVILVAVVVVAAVTAVVLGLPILRTRGLYFAIATLAIGVIGTDVANNWVEVTQGPIGLAGIERPDLLGWDLSDLQPMYFFAAVVAFLAVGVVAFFARSRYGQVLVAVREDEQLAQSFGYRTLAFKVGGFALSSVIAAVAGIVYAYAIQYVSPTPFSFLTGSFQAFVVVAVGGGGTVWGPVVAAVLLVGVPDLLDFSPTTNQFIYAVALLVVVVALRGGVVPALRRLARRAAPPRPPVAAGTGQGRSREVPGQRVPAGGPPTA